MTPTVHIRREATRRSWRTLISLADPSAIIGKRPADALFIRRGGQTGSFKALRAHAGYPIGEHGASGVVH